MALDSIRATLKAQLEELEAWAELSSTSDLPNNQQADGDAGTKPTAPYRRCSTPRWQQVAQGRINHHPHPDGNLTGSSAGYSSFDQAMLELSQQEGRS